MLKENHQRITRIIALVVTTPHEEERIDDKLESFVLEATKMEGFDWG
jgi:hypothetical protein